MAEVDDLQGDLGILLAQADLGGGAAGVTLDVGETLLNDAEEGDLHGLGKAFEGSEGKQLGFNAAALAEAVDVFLESGEQAEVIEKRGMEEIRKSTDFAGHLLGEVASFFEGAGGGLFLGGERLANLGEAEVDGEDGLREAVVEFATNAAAFVILKLEQAVGKVVDGALGVLHFGNVGEGADEAHDFTIGTELRNDVANGPEDIG